MGCNNSRNIQVQPVAATPRPSSVKADLKNNNKVKASPKKNKVDPLEPLGLDSDLEGDPLDNLTQQKNKKNKSKKSLGSLSSVRSAGSRGSERGGSATSKASKHSEDSGLGDDYAHVITEYSDENKIRTVEDEFQECDLDLSISGQPCSRRTSAKDRERQEEQRILASLREEGLIARPKSRAVGGLSFEVVMDGPDKNALARPPPRLAKLERRKKKKKELSAEEIKEKLEKAEKRRKQQEQDRLAKISATTNKSDVLTALNNFEKAQNEKVNLASSKVDTAAENREKKLKELRDKLKAKEEHAEKVRRRKKLAPITPHPESAQAGDMEAAMS